MAVTTRAAAEQRTRAIELILRLRRPADAVVSPDGSQVAFPVSAAYAEKGERPRSAIWVAATDGSSEARQVTRGDGQDLLPRWSPTGDALAFASDRDHPGRMSLHVLGRGPCEALALGDVEGSVEDVQWAPDRRTLLVLAADIGSDRAGVQAATRIEEVGREEQDPVVTRPAQAWRRLYRIDVESGETREVSTEGLTVWEFDWRGGDTAAAIVSEDPTESGWYGAGVVLLDLDGRSAETVYEPEWQVAVPRLLPGGRGVCFLESFCSDRGVLAGVPTLVERGGSARRLEVDADVSWLERRDDGSFWYAGWRGLGTVCGRLSLAGDAEELTGGDETLGTRHQPRVSASADGRVLVAVRESSGDPPEVAVLETASGGRWQPVTDLNGDVATELTLPRWEELSWRARDGLEIEGLLALPLDAGDDSLPLVVTVHGGPTGAWSHAFVNGLTLTEAGYAVFFPNPRGSIGRGQEFARANFADLGGEDLQDILAGVDSLVESGRIDGERLAIFGGSYGGFMAAWAITQTDRFAASIPFASVTDWTSFHLTTNIGRFDELFLDADPFDPSGRYPERSPVFHARRVRTPTLIVHGEADLCVPVGQAQEMYRALVEAGAETELVIYPREGHGVVEREHQIDLIARIVAWLDRHLDATSPAE